MKDDIDATPSATLLDESARENFGSLERGIHGDYQFDIGAILSEAWAKTNGVKWQIQLTLTLYLAIYILVAVAVSFAFGGHSEFMEAMRGAKPTTGAEVFAQMGRNQLQNLIVTTITAPMSAGIFIVGLRRAVGAPIAPTMILRYYGKFAAIALTFILTYAMIVLGFLLLVIPGIYLSLAYYLTLPLVIDKNISGWQALEASRKAIGKHWFGVFGLSLVLGLLNIATIFTLGIGLIWTIPMTIIAFGILYRNIFGCEPTTLAD